MKGKKKDAVEESCHPDLEGKFPVCDEPPLPPPSLLPFPNSAHTRPSRLLSTDVLKFTGSRGDRDNGSGGGGGGSGGSSGDDTRE